VNYLITGGTGYFGQAFAMHLLQHEKTGKVCIYSRGEFAQHLMRQKFGNDERLRFFIGDVRDQPRLQLAMRGADVVVHAAALKRVEVGEYNPTEMVQTNIDGTRNVITAALNMTVNRNKALEVVYLSTDKACAPLNCYGATKLVGEKLMLAANNVAGENGPKFAVTRYGNVAGSTGSIIPTWREALFHKDWGKRVVTMTDPDCTRYWMSLQEAVNLVEWTIMNMLGGELVIPSLPAYSVADLATAMDASTVIKTGLNPGEKKHEEMISESEAQDFWRMEKSGYWLRANWASTCSNEAREHRMSSDQAERLSVNQIRKLLEGVE
jgi:UDP-N-acetylglucosamine 4,6-dehydratase